MAVEKINFEDKIRLQNDENIPKKNKITDDDMNEIKDTVNNNADELLIAQQNIEDLQDEEGIASTDITNLKNRVNTLETDNTKNKQDIENKVDKEEGKGLSTEDYTTEEKQKLAGLNNYDDTQIKEDVQELQKEVNNIKEEQTSQNKKIEEIEDNQINITTEKSESINVQDCSGQDAKINVFGVSKQETSEQGNNILDLDSPFLTDKIYNSQGEEQFYSNANTYSLKLEDGINYFVKIATGGSHYTKWKNNVFVSHEIKNSGVVEEIKDDTFDEIRYSLFTSVSDFESCYINKNSNIGYEDFSPDMPSPRYPSEIENTTGNVDITKCNKNLFDKTKITDNYYLNENGGLLAHSSYCVSDFINVAENETYFLPMRGTSRTKFYNENKEILTSTWDIADGDKSFIVPNRAKYIRFSINKETVNVDTFQFEKNNMATEYEAHEEETITFPLVQGQKMYEGSCLLDDGIHYKRKQIELDGTENWVLHNDNDADKTSFRYETSDLNLVKNGIVLCTHYKNVSYYANKVNTISQTDYYGVRIIIITEKMTLEDFKIFLSQQKQAGTPVIIEYELAEEETETYTEEQQEIYNQLQNAKTYKTVTNVFTENAQVQMNYIADTKTYVDNEINKRLSNLESQVLELAGGN